MVIKPKVRGFICTTAHPLGCRENVKKQIEYVKQKGKTEGPKKVLVIGSSTGYGLSSRIAVTYGCGASTLGIMFERPASGKRTATPGWYNTKAFDEIAAADGYYAETINGDAFSKEIKDETVERIKEKLGKVDMVIYSLAAPRRTLEDGTTYVSVLKTRDGIFENKSLDLRTNEITRASISPATEDEAEATVKVMGGEDWYEWIKLLSKEGVLEDNAVTLAYSYIGPELTYPVYYNGTIGEAKKHLYDTSVRITNELRDTGVRAFISVNKALVTQASAAIPIVPLYMAILYKVMKEKNLHEGCIEQMTRLFYEKLNGDSPVLDDENRIRLDDWEMREDIQKQVMDYWELVETDCVEEYTDLTGYWDDFYHMFGFGYSNIDYDEDIQEL